VALEKASVAPVSRMNFSGGPPLIAASTTGSGSTVRKGSLLACAPRSSNGVPVMLAYCHAKASMGVVRGSGTARASLSWRT
jgi:hypothetical protein